MKGETERSFDKMLTLLDVLVVANKNHLVKLKKIFGLKIVVEKVEKLKDTISTFKMIFNTVIASIELIGQYTFFQDVKVFVGFKNDVK